MQYLQGAVPSSSLVCIFVSVFANVQGTLFMQTLIDGYIMPAAQ